MVTAYDLMKRLQEARNGISNEVEKIVYNNENDIIKLNTSQIEKHIGFDERKLINPLFRGVYSKNHFNELGDFHQAGQKYDFTNTGDFFRGFEVEVLPNQRQIKINSTGTGSGDKAMFFKGYYNIFGLTTQNQQKLNYEIILPDLQKFIKQTIG